MFFGQKTEKLKKEVFKKQIGRGRMSDATRMKISKAMEKHRSHLSALGKTRWSNKLYRETMKEIYNTRTERQIKKRIEKLQYELEHTPENFFGV